MTEGSATDISPAGASLWQRLFGNQPTWGWAALGGAAVVFGAVWFGTPTQTAPGASTQIARTTLPTQQVRFDRPPVNATPFINHHTAMGFDPFNDHVGTTMVSHGSTSASSRSGVPQEEAEFQSKRPADFVPLPGAQNNESPSHLSAP